MQHDIDLKELKFDLLTPRVGEQNIYYRVAAFAILFLNLICSEKVEFDLLTQSLGEGGGRGSAAKIFATVLLHFVIPFI